MEQLKAEYTLRDQLWLDLEKKMNEIGILPFGLLAVRLNDVGLGLTVLYVPVS